MEIILLKSVDKLGDKGDVVKVKNGYARNFLIPQKYAILATPSNVKMMEENKRQAAHKAAQLIEEAEALAEKLKSAKILIETLAGADGKLFGAVTQLQLSNHLASLGFDIDRKQLLMKEDIRFVGEYSVEIKLHKEVIVPIDFSVVSKQQ